MRTSSLVPSTHEFCTCALRKFKKLASHIFPSFALWGKLFPKELAIRTVQLMLQSAPSGFFTELPLPYVGGMLLHHQPTLPSVLSLLVFVFMFLYFYAFLVYVLKKVQSSCFMYLRLQI